jgi:hypothetical protein
LLKKEVNKWGIELTMEMPHIEWCFQFKKWKDLDKVKYVHVVNLKAFKDDPQQVVVFLSMPFSMLQVRIIYPILKMDDNLHSKSCERRKFKVANFPNRTTKLIHQMWDEMVIMIVIEKDNRMVITFEIVQNNVEGSLMIRAPKKKKKEATIKEKMEKTIDNLIMKKYPKGFNEIKCKHVNESIRKKISNYFPLGNKSVERVKVLVDRFLPPLGRIVYRPLNDTHKNKIKH